MVKKILNQIKYFGQKIISSRIMLTGAIMTVMFIVVVIGLFRIQIVKGEEYRENYTQLSYTTLTTDASRGIIYDRNGNPLAYNRVNYAVTITDTGAYSNGYEWNEMLMNLVDILDEHGEKVVTAFPMGYDENGDLNFTTTSDSEKRTLLMNIYGLSSADQFDEVDEEGVTHYPSDPDPQVFLDLALSKFGIGEYRNGDTYEVSRDKALSMLNIRYAMFLVSYMRYEPVVIASNVSEATVTDVLEHADTLADVTISEETVRVYDYAEEFAGILGYTGAASAEELEGLQAEDDSYAIGDIVGKAGIEQVMEQELSGTKGSTNVIIDSKGRVTHVVSETQAVAGNDVYLTLDRDLQVAIYHMLEQTLASIILEHLTPDEVNPADYEDTAKIPISIYDVYFQMFNNNIVSIQDFSRDDASGVEQFIYSVFTEQRDIALRNIAGLFSPTNTTPYSAYDEYTIEYVDYCMQYLKSNNYLTPVTDDAVYAQWAAGEISLYEYIEHAVTSGWVDISGFNIDGAYSTTSETINALSENFLSQIADDTEFDKLVYSYMIHSRLISGNQVCLTLYYQGALEWDADAVNSLSGGGSAYNWMVEKIRNLEITPAMIALDPCTASCVVMDVQSSDPIAIVSYPGYDLNMLSGTVDADYYNSLLNNQSNPLYNNATQGRTAPGSTFKPITSIASLEEGIITPSTLIDSTGVFTERGMNLRCWYYPSAHGMINVRQAIMVSCNYFFCEMGYELSLDSDGNYSEALGLERLSTYASMFGLDSTTGIELPENEPHISDYSSIASAIGQGTHAFTCMNMARYAMALANNGNVYDLTLLDHTTDYEGNLLQSYDPELMSTADVSPETLSVVRSAMNGVVSEGGSCAGIFANCVVSSAGKTGTAEQSSVRGPHALFIGFAPFESPEIAYAVQIPFGYTSAHSAELGCSIVNYYFDDSITLDDILEGGAASLSGVAVAD